MSNTEMGNNSIMDYELRKYESRTRKSFELFNQAKESTPFGVHSNYRYIDPYPMYGTRAKRSRIWDVDGNEYLDFNMGFGALLVGHSHPVLVEAIEDRVRDGSLLGLEFEDSDKLARVMKERFQLDMIRFSTTGMEATMHAIRFARAATGRNKIVKFEGCYHGSQDHLLVSVKPQLDKSGDARHPNAVPASKGTPTDTLRNTIVAPFNDLEAVETLVRENQNDFAGIILEPIPMNMGFIMPEGGFLQGLRSICDEYNAVLIFDEVKTCGKYYGGATERFGVEPDLKVMGKAIAGGFPLSAVGGRRKIMEQIVPGIVAHAGTFNSNPISITAGLVSLTKILTRDAFSGVSKLNRKLASAYSQIVEDNHLEANVCSDGVSGVLSFSSKPILNWRDFQKSDVGKWSLYYLMMLNRGIIPAGTGPDEQWTISVQHTEEDVDRHIETFKEVAPMLKEFDVQMPIVEAI
jgi:glutamate-1-semialdehyde 2,1-aminomutase